MEREPRVKQFFVLILLSVFCFGLLCISGCGGTSCETIKCGSYEDGDSYAKGISVPGCAGCYAANDPVLGETLQIMEIIEEID